LEQKENALCTLRTLITDLLLGKDEFVIGAMNLEQELRNKVVECKSTFDTLLQSKMTVEGTLKDCEKEKDVLHQQLGQVTKERDESMTKYDLQSVELQSTKDKVGRLQQSITDQSVELALIQSKLDEANAAKDETLSQLKAMESSNVEAIRTATTTIRNEINAKLSHVQSENDVLKKELLIKATETKEICNLMNINVSTVDFTNSAASNSFVNVIKERVNELERSAEDKEGMQEELSRCKVELEKVTSDYQVRDLSELVVRLIFDLRVYILYH
jgi:chromosome segregation ATPase